MTVRTERDGEVLIVTVDRPEVRNAVDRPTADALEAAFRSFDVADDLSVAVLTGAGGTFCAGADLRAVADAADADAIDTTDPGSPAEVTGDAGQRPADRVNRVERGDRGPMGPSRLLLDKPVIAAVEGHAVAGGLELALWCDLRVVADDAVLGVFCRRWGVPLVDGGTVRLPRLVGLSRALDLILTGRPVGADEALAIGLANRVVPTGHALAAAVELAHSIARFPQATMRADRRSAHEGLDLPRAEALLHEHDLGVPTLTDPQTVEGLRAFSAGAGRHGSFDAPVAP